MYSTSASLLGPHCFSADWNEEPQIDGMRPDTSGQSHAAQALQLLRQICADASAPWQADLLASDDSLVDVLINHFAGAHPSLSVTIQDGRAIFQIESKYLDAAPIILLCKALAAHAPQVAAQLLVTALCGCEYGAQSTKLAEALAWVAVDAGATLSMDAHAPQLFDALGNLLADPAIDVQTKRGFEPLLGSDVAKKCANLLVQLLQANKAGDASASQEIVAFKAAHAFYVGLLANDDGLAALSLATLQVLRCDQARGLVEHCAKDRPSDILSAPQRGKALEWAAASGNDKVVAMLLTNILPNEIGQIREHGAAALAAAAKCGDLKIVSSLLEKGFKADAKLEGQTALAWAAGNGHEQVVNELLKHLSAAQVNMPGTDGITPLMAAAKGGHLKVVASLSNKGADIGATTPDGATALYYACENGRAEVVKKLLERLRSSQVNASLKSGMTAVMAAAKCGDVAAVSLLLKKGAIITAKPNCTNAVHLAVQAGHEGVVKHLLANMNSSQINQPDEQGCTALFHASVSGHAGCVALLLAKKANPHVVRTRDGASPLHLAAAHGHLEIIKLFLARDDRFDLAQKTTLFGCTPVKFAAENDMLDAVAMLQVITPASPPSRLASGKTTDQSPPRVWCWSGAEFHLHQDSLNDAAKSGTQSIELTFVGENQNKASWAEFLKVVKQPGLAGSQWHLYCHGRAWKKDFPQHALQFGKGEGVPTTQATRALIAAGVRKITVVACHAKQAANHFAQVLLNDPGSPQVVEPFEVTFIGDEDTALMSLGETELTWHLRDLASPDKPSIWGKVSAMPRSIVTFDPKTRTATVDHLPGLTMDNIGARLFGLTEEEQRHLIGRWMVGLCEKGKTAEIKRVIETYPQLIDVNYQLRKYRSDTVLELATLDEHLDIMEVLLAQPGVDPDAGHEPPLRGAAANGNLQAIQLLLNNGARLEAEGSSKQTALYAAAKLGQLSAVKFLLEQGASMICTTGSALEAASSGGHVDVMKLLLDQPGIDPNQGAQLPLHRAAKSGNVQALELLLNKGAKLDGEDSDGETASCIAVRYGHLPAVKFLLEQGAGQTFKSGSLLETAAASGRLEVMKLLLALPGMNPNAGSQPPLFWAARHGHLEAIELLMKKKANIDAEGTRKQTAVYAAARHGHLRAVKLLIGYHPSLKSTGSARKRAEQEGHKDVADLLDWYHRHST